jgi:hypothetical protein
MKILWWTAGKNDVATVIYENVAKLVQDDSGRQDRNLRSLRLYGNANLEGLGPYSMARSVAPVLPDNRVKVNVISSMVDTVTSKIAKMKPKVTFLTSGGDWSEQENAKQLNKFMLGAFYGNKVHMLHQEGFKDAAIFDVGALKHYISGDKIVSERVLPTELYVDAVDALYGNPRSLFQVKYLHKDVLKKLFPKKTSIIGMAKNSLDRLIALDNADDYVAVVEAWHLPSVKGAGDGRHVICVDSGWLIDEEWDKDYFPFTFFRWASRGIGFWGQSLAERLTGNQIEINKMLRIIQKSFHLGSAFKVFLEYGSRVSKEQLSNEIGSIIYYTGTKPDFYVPQTVHPEFFQHLNFLIQASYEEAGVSQLSASSRKPAGLDSGKALREYNEVETERFAITSQTYEQSFLDTARIYIDLAKDIAKDGGDFAVVAHSKKFIESIKWSQVAVEENQYIMQMFPTSMLPQTPAGRIQYVQELVNNGYIPKEYALKLLDFPDLESYTDLINAPIDNLMDALEDILVKGKYNPPEPYQDLQMGIKMFQSAYLKGRTTNVPEARLEDLRTWISTAEAMLAKAAESATMTAQAQLPGAAPQDTSIPPEAAGAPVGSQMPMA